MTHQWQCPSYASWCWQFSNIEDHR